MSITVEDILKQPSAIQLVEQAKLALDEEMRRRMEFREWVTPGIKAEFINGNIVLHSPVKRRHSIAAELMFRLLSIFSDIKKLGEVRFDKAMVALSRNDYEPDICFWKKEKTTNFHDGTMLYPAPDFVVEVLSKSTQKHDRTTKYKDYALHGIREYWIVDPEKKMVEQHGLLTENDKSYLPFGKFSPGDEITSIVLPGLTIDVSAFFNEADNLKALQEIMKA